MVIAIRQIVGALRSFEQHRRADVGDHARQRQNDLQRSRGLHAGARQHHKQDATESQ